MSSSVITVDALTVQERHGALEDRILDYLRHEARWCCGAQLALATQEVYAELALALDELVSEGSVQVCLPRSHAVTPVYRAIPRGTGPAWQGAGRQLAAAVDPITAARLARMTPPADAIREGDLETALSTATMDWKPGTRRKYAQCQRSFVEFLGAEQLTMALCVMADLGPLEAHLRAQVWRDDLRARGYSASYVAQHVAALKAAWRLVRTAGLAQWSLDLRAPRVSTQREVRGPCLEEVQRLVAAAAEGDPSGRDQALILVLAVLGLRRAEVSRLDVGHFDRVGARLSVLGKGKDDSQWVPVPQTVGAALGAYLDARRAADGEPLFANRDRRTAGSARLSSSGIYRVVKRLGRVAGLARPLSPHQLRHFAITQALEASAGDVRRVKAFSRHAKLDTVLVYDDARHNHSLEIASLVAAAVARGRSEESAADPADTPADGASGEVECAAEMGLGMGVSVTIGPSERAELSDTSAVSDASQGTKSNESTCRGFHRNTVNRSSR